jgi:hypothetical protein
LKNATSRISAAADFRFVIRDIRHFPSCLTPYRSGNRYRLRFESCNGRREQQFGRWEGGSPSFFGPPSNIQNIGLQGVEGHSHWCLDLESKRTRDGNPWILWPCKHVWWQTINLPLGWSRFTGDDHVRGLQVGFNGGSVCMVEGRDRFMVNRNNCPFNRRDINDGIWYDLRRV